MAIYNFNWKVYISTRQAYNQREKMRGFINRADKGDSAMATGQGVLIGIDIGTSGCKIAAFGRDGTAVAQCTEAYPTRYPAPGCVEQDAGDWWAAVCRGVRRLISGSELHAEQIQGIGVAGQSWAALPVDVDGVPLRDAMIWLDARSGPQLERLRREVGEERMFALSGNPLAVGYTTGKILWLKEHEPEVYRRTHKFVQSNSFIVQRLTGAFTQDVSQGYGVHAFDVKRFRWDESLCGAMGIDPRKLPPLVGCGDIVGGVSAWASAETGLVAGTPVAAGGLDAACGTLGAGVMQPGETQEQGGQAGGMSIALDAALAHPRLILGCHVVPNRWLLQGGTVGGGSLNWLRREFGEGPDWFAQLNREAELVPPGASGLLFLPYMAGERSPIWDEHARGTLIGLAYDKTRGAIARAIMEGCAFALRHNLLTAEEAGADVTHLVSMGGAANSRLWTQIKADVTGKPIRIPVATDLATTLGAAMLAGVGIGWYADFEETIRCTRTAQLTFEPDPAAHAYYGERYELYREAYERLQTLYPRLGGA
jgi:xylulokinase